MLMANSTFSPTDPIENVWSCKRLDGRDLIKEWAMDKAGRNLRYAVVNNTKSLLSLNTANTDFLMGEFLVQVIY